MRPDTSGERMTRNIPSNLSGLRMLGWTQEVPDFLMPVQPVQPVQPKIKAGRKEASLPLHAVDRRRLNARNKICQKGWAGRPSWTQPITVGMSHVQRRIGRLDGLMLRLDIKYLAYRFLRYF